MTENENPTPSTTDAAPAAAAPNPEKMAQAEKVVGELLARLEVKARLELKDAADGGISVAMHLEQEVPGLAAGKRSHIVDALQFLANKIVNRPTGERRWISLGVGGHPEPRPPKPERPPRAPQPPVEGAPAGAPAPARPAHAKGPRADKRAEGAPEQRPAAAKPPPAAKADPEELKLEVAEDAAMTALARKVAEKSAQHGRFYAVAPMKAEDRARILKAAAGVAGVKVTVEGEGRSRRVLFSPEKPTPMPKKGVMPDYDEDEAEA